MNRTKGPLELNTRRCWQGDIAV